MNILIIALNEFKMMTRNRASFLLLILMPLFMIGLMGYAMKSAFQQEKALDSFPVLYVNEDDGTIGKAFDNLLKEQVSDYLVPVEVDLEEAKLELSNRKYSSVIIIPDGLSEKVEEGGEISIEVLSSGKDQLQDQITRSIVSSFINSVNLQSAMAKGYTEYLSPSDAIKMLQKNTQGTQVGNSDYISEHTVDIPALNKLSSFQYFTASMLLFFLFSAGAGIGANIIKERTEKIYARINTFRVKKSEYLLGQILASLFTAVLQSAVVILFTKYIFRVDWGTNMPGVVLTLLLTAALSSALGILFSSLMNTQKAVSSTMAIVMWLIAFAGGAFAPVPALEPVGKLTFYKWGMNSLTTFMVGGTLKDTFSWLSMLGATVIVIWTVSLISYGRRVSHE